MKTKIGQHKGIVIIEGGSNMVASPATGGFGCVVKADMRTSKARKNLSRIYIHAAIGFANIDPFSFFCCHAIRRSANELGFSTETAHYVVDAFKHCFNPDNGTAVFWLTGEHREAHKGTEIFSFDEAHENRVLALLLMSQLILDRNTINFKQKS